MSLSALLDNVDALPKEVQAHYFKTNDGKFKLQVDEVAGWQMVNEGEQHERITALEHRMTVALRELQTYGVFVQNDGTVADHQAADGRIDAKAAKQALKRVQRGELKDPAEIEQLRKQLEEKAEADRQSLDQERAQHMDSLRTHLIDTPALTHMAQIGAKASIVMPHIRGMARLEKDNGGTPRTVFKDEQGRTVLSKKYGDSSPMGVVEMIDHLSKDKEWSVAFPARDAGGSGAAHHSAGGAAFMNEDPSKLTGKQLLQRANQQG